jgi:hypothetical protein
MMFPKIKYYENLSLLVIQPGLDDQASILNRSRTFLFVTMSRSVLGPTQPPIQLVPGALSLGKEWLGSEDDHSPPCSAKVKNAWSYTSTPPHIFMVRYLIKQEICLQGMVLS